VERTGTGEHWASPQGFEDKSAARSGFRNMGAPYDRGSSEGARGVVFFSPR
jgi:hypothetical protein